MFAGAAVVTCAGARAASVRAPQALHEHSEQCEWGCWCRRGRWRSGGRGADGAVRHVRGGRARAEARGGGTRGRAARTEDRVCEAHPAIRAVSWLSSLASVAPC